MAPALEVTNWLQKPPALAKWPADRPVLLEFWSISCGPCIGRIPENNKLAEWVESQGGVFVSVHSATHEIPEIRAFLENHELRYAVGLDKAGGPRPYSGSATFAAYGIDATPTCVTIGRSGRILSYRHLSTQALEKLLAQEPAEAPRGRSSAEVRPLTVLPGAWRVSGLEPGAEAQGRVFLFRPDTPDLTLRAARDTNSPVRPTWTRHSAGSQTVYEIQLRAKAPDYGRTLKGQIALIAEYNKQEHLVDIPYQIAGRGLVHCDTPALWFGCLHPGDTITKDITLRATAQPPVHVDVGSVPAGLRVRRQEQEVSSTGPRITVSFSSPQPGLHEGVLNLLVSDDNGNRQSVPLGYCAFVQP
jgi:thiol-disulfide isomerase/thioredoxin